MKVKSTTQLLKEYKDLCERILKENRELLSFNEELLNENKEFEEDIEELQNRISRAIDKLYEWGEVLQPEFQQEMLKILKGEDIEQDI